MKNVLVKLWQTCLDGKTETFCGSELTFCDLNRLMNEGYDV